jgi:hypothetical protein
MSTVAHVNIHPPSNTTHSCAVANRIRTCHGRSYAVTALLAAPLTLPITVCLSETAHKCDVNTGAPVHFLACYVPSCRSAHCLCCAGTLRATSWQDRCQRPGLRCCSCAKCMSGSSLRLRVHACLSHVAAVVQWRSIMVHMVQLMASCVACLAGKCKVTNSPPWPRIQHMLVVHFTLLPSHQALVETGTLVSVAS